MLGHSFILRSKHHAKEIEMLWTALYHTVAHRYANIHTHVASTVRTGSLLLRKCKSKELGSDSSCLVSSFPTQGGRMNNILHYPQHWTNVSIPHVNKYRMKNKRRKTQKPQSPIKPICNSRQAINFCASRSVNKVSGFCSMGIY